ncbi:MAG TPA: O-antigen ligase family protein, partial [Chitinophagaceae bacterium]|nr:O-antigen ligase family protein [Chitinophagaceae bacterium]
CIYLAIHAQNLAAGIGLSVSAVFLLVSMFVLGLATGIANFFILLFAGCCILIFRQGVKVKLAGSVLLVASVILAARYITGVADEQLAVRETRNNVPASTSIAGNLYIHFDSAGQKENGNYVLMNIQLEELQRVWKREFPADSFNYAQQHNLRRYEVLVRYMASKGLNKDSAAFTKLTLQDKLNIRKGFSNYLYPDWGLLRRRLYELVNEYDEYRGNRFINGHSLTMRLYFWQAAMHVAKQHPLVGVGTGDVQEELDKAYKSTRSPLSEEWYKRPHNQFLTIMVALGAVGLLVFIFSIIYPVWRLRTKLHVLFWPFIILAVLSFMLEDTLETQAGLTFYAFFNSFFISMAVTEE